jgi:hypothetical protein
LEDIKVSLNPARPEFTPFNWRPGQKLRVDVLFEGDPAPHPIPYEGNWALFEWLVDAENHSGGREGFLWIPRSGSGRFPSLRDNGKPMDYKIQVQWEGTSLDHSLFEPKSCVLPVAN